MTARDGRIVEIDILADPARLDRLPFPERLGWDDPAVADSESPGPA